MNIIPHIYMETPKPVVEEVGRLTRAQTDVRFDANLHIACRWAYWLRWQPPQLQPPELGSGPYAQQGSE